MSYKHPQVVTTEQSIQDVLRAIDQAALGIAFVSDDSGRVIASVTDGDVRRGLLAGVQLGDPVERVMHRDPVVAPVSAAPAEVLDLLRTRQINVIPLVDEAGALVRIETLDSALAASRVTHHDNPVFIMAGGFGTRLRPLTDDTPKPMLKVGDRPMLQHLVERFVARGFTRLYISTHYLPEVIREHFGDGSAFGARIEYVHEHEPLGTGGALGLLPADRPRLPLVLVNGDVLTDIDIERLLEHHVASGAVATMVVREHEFQIPFGVVESYDGSIIRMTEKPVVRHQVNTGIYVLDPSTVDAVTPGVRVDLPTHIERLIAQGERVGTYLSTDFWMDVGRPEDLERAQREIVRLGGRL